MVSVLSISQQDLPVQVQARLKLLQETATKTFTQIATTLKMPRNTIISAYNGDTITEYAAAKIISGLQGDYDYIRNENKFLKSQGVHQGIITTRLVKDTGLPENVVHIVMKTPG